jgi:autophagy-related protein 9
LLIYSILKVYFLEELLSPFITPIILCFHLRRKSLQIIDFLRNYTVDVQGVGDVCSFAQLDVGKYGDLKVNLIKFN